MTRPSKRKLQSRTAAATWRKTIRLQSTESRDAESPTFAEPAIPEIQDSEPLALHSPSDSDSNTGSDGGMPGTWPELSEAEDEQQEQRGNGEECRATETVVRTLGQPKMHNTILPNGTEQSMVFRQINHKWGSNLLVTEDLSGKPKGMK